MELLTDSGGGDPRARSLNAGTLKKYNLIAIPSNLQKKQTVPTL